MNEREDKQPPLDDLDLPDCQWPCSKLAAMLPAGLTWSLGSGHPGQQAAAGAWPTGTPPGHRP
jgi:hypothetical protein